MAQDLIAEIGIDDEQRLWVRPLKESFDQIFRSGMEVHWDNDRKRLFSPKPRQWSYLRWFAQIVSAAANEYGVSLKLTPATVWRNVPNDLKAAIQGFLE